MKLNLTARNKSLILSGIACAGVVLTGWLSARASRKADACKTKKDKVIAYIPPVVAGGVTIGCIAASTYYSGEEIAALTLACAAAAQKLTDYQKAVHETVSPDEEAKIKEAFYLKEIDRLEQELAEREHPRDDDDYSTFVDGYSGYTFRAPYEQVEEGIKNALELYETQNYLCWCDIFYLANNGDCVPYDSYLGQNYCDYGVGWSKAMFDELYADVDDYAFGIFLTKLKGKDNTYVIDYSSIPEPCYMEY